MNFARQHQILDDFGESVVGLRRGEIGRANTHLDALLKHISGHLGMMPPSHQQRALPVIQHMLAAKERDDRITLADCLEYELPAILDEDEFSPSLLSIEATRILSNSLAHAKDETYLRQAAAEVADLYSRNNRVAGLGSLLATPLYFEQQYKHARRLLDADDAAGRRTASGAYLRALLEARDANYENADALMSWAYSSAPALRDGFIQIAWICHESGRNTEALDYIARDQKHARLSPAAEAKAALILGASGKTETAIQMVHHAYAADSELRDAFAALGWQSYEKMNLEAADRMINEDLTRNRLSPMYQCYLAMIRARLGQWNNAKALVESAYKKDSGVRDGFGRIGWAGFLMGRGTAFFESHIEKDRALKRQALNGRLFNVVLSSAKGKLGEAIVDTERAYVEHPNERNWLSILGWPLFRSGDIKKGCELLDRDKELGRMNSAMIPTYAAVLGANGRTNEALGLLNDQVSERGEHEIVCLGVRLRPDVTMELGELAKLIEKRTIIEDVLKVLPSAHY